MDTVRLADTTNEREAPLPTVMRTMEQEARLTELNRMYTTVVMSDAQLAEQRQLASLTPFVELARARTVEEEERWTELGNMTVPWTSDQRREYEALCLLLPHPHPIPPRIYVRVWRDPYGTWSVTVRVGRDQRDLPSVAVIRALINPADKHYLPSRQGRHHSTIRILRNSLEAGLPAQSLHDALRAWIMVTENQVTDAESSIPATGIDPATASLLRAQPATLEVGGKVFRLVPAHEIDVRPLITRVRQRTIAHARVETDALRERARVDARTLTTEAERQAARLRAEAETILRRAGSKVPDWVRDSGRSHYFSSDRWYVELRVNCYLRDIRFLVREWGTVLHWTPIRVASHPIEWYNDNKCPLWFRIGEDGTYDKNSTFRGEWDTPHIGSFMCMELQNKPPVVNSIDHLVALEKAISRGMQVLNLNSPISRQIDDYYPAIKEQIPTIPAKMLRGEIYIQPGSRSSMADFKEHNPSVTWDSAETLRQEDAGVFSADAPTLPATAIAEAEHVIAVAEELTRR